MQPQPDLPPVASLAPQGTWEERDSPATLDLAERLRHSVNALTRLREDLHHACENLVCWRDGGPEFANPSWLMVKYLRALPLARAASGSAQGLEREHAALRSACARISPRGFLLSPKLSDLPADTSYPFFAAVLVQALLTHARLGDERWLAPARRLVEGLKAGVVRRGDYAYVPPECSLGDDGEWKFTLRPPPSSPEAIPYRPPEEPIHDTQGAEGSVKFEQAGPMLGLLGAAESLGDEQALDTARLLARFCLKPALWRQDLEQRSVPPCEHGEFGGHFHGNITPLIALLRLATLDRDRALMQRVREGYEHARAKGAIRLGFMPAWVKPLIGRDEAMGCGMNEGCGSADMVVLAVQLSDAGMGDHWDDVDALVRNHFGELQITDLESLRRSYRVTTVWDEGLRGCLGMFTQAPLTANRLRWLTNCCTANGARALYHAWEAILRERDGHVTVNLLLNRSSPWLDVDSHLPHEGRVVLRVKRARSVALRLPGWVDAQSVRIADDRAATLVGRHLLLNAATPGEAIEIRFALPDSRERWSIHGTAYSARIRGSTVLEVEPRLTAEPGQEHLYPFFRREGMTATAAPMARQRRFVAEHLPRAW